ncbi:hypothetical protein [Streptomyces smyrnaeus]|uniref:Uncharacterized protein n=1 Tax=Streptomyces smyrnaeus TaxID=1387713 RepID=A0ABS3Y651_9ACTN|nr:hypothetical protein [Streptomyces smyrnaeus]MBO8203145.1 hypothetical protein [Streptomyces smyrnaeus]
MIQHPTVVKALPEVLNQAAAARRAENAEELRAVLAQLLGPCPAAAARSAALRELVEIEKKSRARRG